MRASGEMRSNHEFSKFNYVSNLGNMTITMTGAETAGPRGAEVTTEFGTGSGIEPREEEVAATDK